jgi:hypothetical protein
MPHHRFARRARPGLWALGVTLAVGSLVAPAAAEPFIPTWQPDGRVRGAGDTFEIGDDVHNDSGVDQTVRTRVRAGRTAKFVIRFQHDGEPIDDTWLVTGAAGSPGFPVGYRSDGTDVTAEVTSGSFQQTVGSAGLAPAIKVRVSVMRDVPSRTTKTVPVAARSLINGAGDTVRARVRVK